MDTKMDLTVPVAKSGDHGQVDHQTIADVLLNSNSHRRSVKSAKSTHFCKIVPGQHMIQGHSNNRLKPKITGKQTGTGHLGSNGNHG